MPKKLAKYRFKRDFTKTVEPSGGVKVAASKRARFVVQKHDATRLHFDFRLELNGVFRSWAVTKGPSLDPRRRRLAVEVEDHPLDYGDFEGTTPKGQYGGGTVMLWDRGTWEAEGGRSAATQLKAGELKFTLHGKKLKGGWVLVRMRESKYARSGSRTNWLLIKHSDGSAREGEADVLIENDRSVASGRTMGQIAAGKARRLTPFMHKPQAPARADAVRQSHRRKKSHASPSGFARQGLRKVTRMPRFVEPQLCTLVKRPAAGDDWVHEIKFDGYRAQLRVENGRAVMLTRKGLNWTEKFATIADEAASLRDCIVDGEVVALDDKGAPDFVALQAALSQGEGERLIFFAFDLLFAEHEDLRPLPLSARKLRLRELLVAAGRSAQIRYVEHFDAAGDAILKSACRTPLEGIVSKRLGDSYRSGRAGRWTKTKCRGGHEVVIGGWSDINGKFRSLLVGTHRGGRLIYVGKVGTGFAQSKRALLMTKLKAEASRDNPFGGDTAPRAKANVHWVKPKLVAEIEFAGWTGDGQVRQASFKGLRADKSAHEVEAERPAAPGKAAPAAHARDVPPPSRSLPLARNLPRSRRVKTGPGRKTAASEEAKTVVMGVTISHPGKPLWPDDGDGRAITKLDLARYYVRVGTWLLPHIQGRPCSLVRAPAGIAGEHFFQRHAMEGSSKLLRLVTVSGDRQPYLEIDRIEGLAAVAQIAGLELHPWNCQPGRPDVPGRLVFDLDPAPDVGFDRVIATAREMKDRLEELGLAAFCKTTGGKGLHVVAPLSRARKGALGWAEAKSFARELCARIAADSPDRYVLSMAKARRKGRIFLDYLRNDRMATAVAPLSPRARDGAPVSMPLAWGQLNEGLDPSRFTVRTVPALIAQSTPWKNYVKSARPLRNAIECLIRRRKK